MSKTSNNELNKVLVSINESLTSTSDSLDNLLSTLNSNNNNEDFLKLQQIIKNSTTSPENKVLEKVSLLSLKNDSMLSYINNLLLHLHTKMPVQENEAETEEEENNRWATIEQRITLERGIKPLEKKLNYQLDKLIRSYYRIVDDYETAAKQSQAQASAKAADEDNSNSESDSDSDSDSDDESAFKPNVAGMVTDNSKKSSKKRSTKSTQKDDENREDNDEEQDEGKSSGTYQPPKINAMLPPTTLNNFEDKFNAKEHKDKSNKYKLQSMEEYINEMNDKPEWEASIGTNIVNHGKGGIKSSRTNDKEKEVKEYEETNFTRLNLTKKKDKRQQKLKQIRDKVNIIGGEDFSIFNNAGSKKRSFEDSTSRKNSNKRSKSAWDRAKNRL